MLRFTVFILGLFVFFGCRISKNENQNHASPESSNSSSRPRAQPTENKPDSEQAKDIIFDSLPVNARSDLPPGLRDFQDVFADVAEKTIPAVVSIYSERNIANPGTGTPYDDFLDKGPFEYFFGEPNSKEHAPQAIPRQRKETGLGSGVIISAEGYILTNNHVIEGADVIKVQLMDEAEYSATVVGTDKPSDMAVIKIRVEGQKLSTLPLGNSDKLRIGEWVLAVGNPYGLSHTVTTGIISAKGRKNTGITSYENFIQTDAAINPGNSGGALLNLSGELIGINTAIFSRSGGYQGIGFAIPINMAKKITQDLIRDGEVTRGWLGVSIQPIETQGNGHQDSQSRKDGKVPHGALVGGIVPGSPAEKSGIKPGDIITKIGEHEIKDANDLLNRIAMLVPNEWVEVWVVRDDMTLSFKTRIAKRDEKRVTGYRADDDIPPTMVGLQVAPLTRELMERFNMDPTLNSGVVVIAVERGSRAMAAKVKTGDVILEINRVIIKDLAAYRSAMLQATKGNKILLRILRKNLSFFTTL